MTTATEFISHHLFDDLSSYSQIVEPWENYINSLSVHLSVNNTYTGMIGTAKVINSIVDSNVYIGDYSLIRNSILEKGSKIGAHTQVNMCIVRCGAELTHFNNAAYSFIGKDVLFGAATVTASVRLDSTTPIIRLPNDIEASVKSHHFGSLVGDGCRIGSHVCLNPASILARGTFIMPLCSVTGYNSGYVYRE